MQRTQGQASRDDDQKAETRIIHRQNSFTHSFFSLQLLSSIFYFFFTICFRQIYKFLQLIIETRYLIAIGIAVSSVVNVFVVSWV